MHLSFSLLNGIRRRRPGRARGRWPTRRRVPARILRSWWLRSAALDTRQRKGRQDLAAARAKADADSGRDGTPRGRAVGYAFCKTRFHRTDVRTFPQVERESWLSALQHCVCPWPHAVGQALRPSRDSADAELSPKRQSPLAVSRCGAALPCDSMRVIRFRFGDGRGTSSRPQSLAGRSTSAPTSVYCRSRSRSALAGPRKCRRQPALSFSSA